MPGALLMLESAVVTCPWCWSPVEFDIDPSAGSQHYVEDCSVCCHPMRVLVTVDSDGSLLGVDVDRDGD